MFAPIMKHSSAKSGGIIHLHLSKFLVLRTQFIVPVLLAHHTLCCMQTFDIESGCDSELLNLNPEGWLAGVSNERNWGMLYGMDVSWQHNMILAGDSYGFLHAVDPRANQPLLGKHQLHKKGNKASTLMLVSQFMLLMRKVR